MHLTTKPYTVDNLIFMGTNFRRLNKHDTFEGFIIRGQYIVLHNPYGKSPNRVFWNSWMGPSTKSTKIGSPRKVNHQQYSNIKIYLCYLNLTLYYSSKEYTVSS